MRGGVVVLDVPNGKEVTRELTRREVLVDYRPNAGIRVAPHFYTADEELDRVIAEIRSIVESPVAQMSSATAEDRLNPA